MVEQVDSHNLIDIINRDINKVAIKNLARYLFSFGLVNGITLFVDWVSREENVFTGELSKLLIQDGWMLAPKFFDILVVSAMAV